MDVTCGTILVVPLILQDTYVLIIRTERLVQKLRQLFFDKAVTGERQPLLRVVGCPPALVHKVCPSHWRAGVVQAPREETAGTEVAHTQTQSL